MAGTIILVALVLLIFVLYNNLMRLKIATESAWADVEAQLKGRHELIPGLIETVNTFTAQERDVMDAVVTARSRAISAQGPAQKAGAENLLTGTLRSLFALADSYPQLRAADEFVQMRRSFTHVEEDIQNARRYYNAVVRELNTTLAAFPNTLLARSFGFRPCDDFDMAEAPRETVRF